MWVSVCISESFSLVRNNRLYEYSVYLKLRFDYRTNKQKNHIIKILSKARQLKTCWQQSATMCLSILLRSRVNHTVCSIGMACILIEYTGTNVRQYHVFVYVFGRPPDTRTHKTQKRAITTRSRCVYVCKSERFCCCCCFAFVLAKSFNVNERHCLQLCVWYHTVHSVHWNIVMTEVNDEQHTNTQRLRLSIHSQYNDDTRVRIVVTLQFRRVECVFICVACS